MKTLSLQHPNAFDFLHTAHLNVLNGVIKVFEENTKKNVNLRQTDQKRSKHTDKTTTNSR